MSADFKFGLFVATFFLTVAAALSWAAFFENQRQERAQALRPECEYLGRARDLSQVQFYECDGKIVMERTRE